MYEQSLRPAKSKAKVLESVTIFYFDGQELYTEIVDPTDFLQASRMKYAIPVAAPTFLSSLFGSSSEDAMYAIITPPMTVSETCINWMHTINQIPESTILEVHNDARSGHKKSKQTAYYSMLFDLITMVKTPCSYPPYRTMKMKKSCDPISMLLLTACSFGAFLDKLQIHPIYSNHSTHQHSLYPTQITLFLN